MKPDRLAVLLLAAFLATGAFAQVFKWVDENGKTHYGEKPPPGVKATELGVPAASPGQAPAASTPDWKEKDLEFKKRQIERERKENVDEATKRRRTAVRASECAEARRRLSRLQEQIPLYTRDSKGDRTYLEDKDRPGEVAKQQRLIAENCE